MAKKRSRKSRRERRKEASQPATPKPPAESAAPARQSRPTSAAAAQDFVKTYAYVYFDLRKMFTLAAVMFLLLIVTNLVLRYLLVW